MKILSYGSLNLDYVYQVPHFVQPGETLSSQSRAVNCGGKGLNQSIALARAGAQVWHAGAIGTDGTMLKNALEENGVSTEFLLTLRDVPTGHAIIQVDSSGQNCILLMGGANRAIPQEHIDRLLEDFTAGEWLVLQNEVCGNGYIMEKAHEKGMKIVLNPSPMDEAVLELPLQYVDWFVLNEVEMEAICGGDAAKLLEKYPHVGIMLTLGSRGAICYYEGQRYAHGIYKTNVVDTTAAGDTFSGYFIASLVNGMDLADAVALASKASSVAVSRAGAQASIPYSAEVEAHDGVYVPYSE